MDWSVSNAFKTYKELEPKSMMDMTPDHPTDPIDLGLGSSEKANNVSPKRKKTMTSAYLKYFETASDGKSRRCKFCGQSYAIATATGNLGRHLNSRHPGYDKTAGTVTASASQKLALVKKPQTTHQLKSPQVDYDHLNWVVIKWLVLSSLPPSTVEQNWLSNSFKFLNPMAQLWPAEKFKAVLQEASRSMQEDVKASLEHVGSKISITLNFWTSYEQIFYMSVTGHWIDESWTFRSILLDIIRVPYPYGGSEIFNSLLKIFKIYNIDERVLCCTHDNSPDSIHACHSLKEYFDGQKILPFCFVPCAARTLNAIIEDALARIKPIISKIREFVQEMNLSSEIAEDFLQLTSAYQEGNWKLPIDASARWSGNHQMLNIICKASKSTDAIIRKYEEAMGNRMVLSSAEKNAVTVVHNYLDLDSFFKTTNDMCTNNDLTIGLVLLFMENISETIASCQKSCHNPDWLRNSAEDMAKKARNYHTQVCNIFTYITAILDPRIKTEYIPDTLSSENNLDEARTHFIRNYSSPSSTHFSSNISAGYRSQDTDDAEKGNFSFAEELARRKRRASMSSTVADELTQYLTEPIVPMQTDVLDWWKVNSTRYPRLSVMARDFLAVRATSVAPEEIFCSKGEEIDRQRYSMPYDSAQAVLCIKSWIESGIQVKFKSTEIDYERLIGLTAVGSSSRLNGNINLDKKPN